MGVPRMMCERAAMKLDALLSAARILRSQPGCSMPLVKVHARLTEELGPGVGSYAELYQQLKNRPQSFLVIDSPRLLPDTTGWPPHVREAYGAALDNAGLGACVRVALTESLPETDHDDALALAGATLSDLWNASARDPIMRDIVTRAAQQLEEINAALADVGEARPTTHPPDPLQ